MTEGDFYGSEQSHIMSSPGSLKVVFKPGDHNTGSLNSIKQCLGSESAKMCGPTDLDPMGKISIKNCKKKILLLTKPKSEKR